MVDEKMCFFNRVEVCGGQMKCHEWFGQEGVFAISHMGEPAWQVRQRLNAPASAEEIENAQDEIGMHLPEDVKKFWKFSDGGELYRSEQDPLWGWRIISTKKYLESQHKWRRKFFNEWRSTYVTIAELMSPVSAIVWDSASENILFLDTSAGDMNPVLIAASVKDFFKNISQSNGALYWQWD